MRCRNARAKRRVFFLLRARRFDLDVNGHALADPGHCFRGLRKHQIEVLALEWVGRYRPARLFCFVWRGEQFQMQCDRLRDAVHG